MIPRHRIEIPMKKLELQNRTLVKKNNKVVQIVDVCHLGMYII